MIGRVLMIPSGKGRLILPILLCGHDAPVVVLHPDTLALYTPVTWVRVAGRLQ